MNGKHDQFEQIMVSNQPGAFPVFYGYGLLHRYSLTSNGSVIRGWAILSDKGQQSLLVIFNFVMGMICSTDTVLL